MDNQHSSLVNWAHYCHGKSMEELKHSLMYTILELEQTKVAVQEELRKKDDQLLDLKNLIQKTIMERNEAQEKCHKLLLEKLLFHQQTAPLSGISSIEDDPRIELDQNNALSSSDCEESIVSSPLIDHFSLQSMIELTPEKPLPEKGKLLQAVIKAGPLLQTLLLAGPLPQWKHPPPLLESFEIPPVTISAPQFLHQDSFFSTNGSSSSTATNCGRVSRKRVLYDGSDSSTDNKYQRVVLQ
ncbi:PREDICTED: uncharacterized protein LOC109350954 [Lupinus angustifolius]|uniref:uncharacterized protein LOC109350954 n=1 Tax=Lupinus angustifolius TaxID=3871 RepID=UPI00092F416D|nr:PREDICTED: uncharacterized protein LOC109350954 [Lupinus angustifolius]XP_019447814.1 PREDICTED: uncharacterized protein LOC109350954 [Lupinus angustifolius]